MQVYNTTLTCRPAAAAASGAAGTPPVNLVAETPAQLLQGIQLLGQLQPFTITLARDMSVPADTWPTGLRVNRSMVLTGLQPPAPRTLLDLYQVRRWGEGVHNEVFQRVQDLGYLGFRAEGTGRVRGCTSF